MSNNYSFAVMPSVSISRSKFARKSQHKTSFNMGQIVPIYVDEVLAGDTRAIDMASLVRMSTPIAPIMDNIYIDYFAFFVPMRLTWEHWKEFFGENKTGAGIPLVQYSIPYLGSNDPQLPVDVGSYADYMGLPAGVDNEVLANNKVSALPFRGLALIYNRWFRNENIIAPLAVQTDDTNEVLVGELSNYDYSYFALNAGSVLKASKLADYFTRSLPYAQKGSAIQLPLGRTATVKLVSDSVAVSAGQGLINLTAINNPGLANGSLVASSNGAGSLVADLSSATAATINDLRYAIQCQKLLEKDALYGSRYWELLASHFGVQAPDASLQDPEYLGGFRQRVNIDQVLSTADYDDTSATQVGKPGANSVTGGKGSVFTKSFTEPGYIYIVAVARHDQTYGQGINKMWTRQGRFDFYWPVFANLGAQVVKKKEIFATGSSSDDDVFGYQEYAAEYRYKPSICSGLLNPAHANALDYWTLANKFASAPTLGKTFIEQGRENIARALATGDTGPDFIADFYFVDIAVRPMPMYSIPGLMDHH